MAQDIDFGHYLDLKYQNQGLAARGAFMEAQARAALANAQTREVAPDAASSRQVNASNAKLSGAQASNLIARTPAEVEQAKASARYYNTQADVGQDGLQPFGLEHALDFWNTAHPQDYQEVLGHVLANPDHYSGFFGPRAPGSTGYSAPLGTLAPANTTPTSGLTVKKYGPGGLLGSTDVTPEYKKGTARVPGKGDGTKDTVKAKLAPGEAVLNKSAAENMGRGLIAALNKQGAQRMGLA